MITGFELNLFAEHLSRYENLSPGELRIAAGIFARRSFKRGEHLLYSGETGEQIHFILSGGFRHYFIDDRANERTTDFCVEGYFTGAIDLLSEFRAPSRDSIVAFEQSVTIAASRGDLAALLAESPAVQSAFSKIILDYYRLQQRRETFLLTSDPGVRYENFLLTFPDICGRVPQYHIASYLNMTPETLSRVRSAGGY